MTPSSAPSIPPRIAPPDDAANPAAIRRVLATSELFAGCSERTLDRLVSGASLVCRPAGHILCRLGDAQHELFVIVQGTVSGIWLQPDGLRQVSGVLGPGHCGPLVSAVDGGPAMLEHRARTAVVLVTVPRRMWGEAEAADPVVRRNALRALCHRTRSLYASAAMAVLLPLRERVSRRVLHLARLGQVPATGNAPVRLVLAQEELAGMLGVTRQSVNRVLRGLEDEGLLRLGRGTIEIPDPARLAEAGAR
jgi:CRP/FNR family cyclic AMP-dependent transcriptional regulator